MKKILITGASGFLGSAAVRLALERGHAVRGTARESSTLDLLEESLKHQQFELLRGEMTDGAALEQAVAGCDAVIHCAATTSVNAPDWELSRRVNVEGTRLLIDAMRKNNAHRLILISSQSAQEHNPSAYGRTKWEQEQLVRASGGIDWTILRPSIIYGPQARGIFDKFAGYCRKLPVIPVIGSGCETMRPVHVDDAAGAALDCLEHEATIGKTYDIGGADEVEFREFIGAILAALGRRKPRLHLPVPLALLLAHALSAVLRNPPLTPDNVRGIQLAPQVDISAARRDFDFQPRKLADGLSFLKKSAEK